MNNSLSQVLKANMGLLTAVTILLICVSHVYFVEGVRGTDQYWYLADVETLANDLPPVTNTVFPGIVLRAGNAELVTNFAHNGPLLHIVSWVARVTTPDFAWKYTNLLFFMLAAVFTGLTVARLSNEVWGYSGAIVFLATPINIWLAGNYLQEMFFCFLSAAILYCTTTNWDLLHNKLLLFVTIALGALSHPLFAIVGFCFALFALAYRRRWIIASLLLCVVFYVQAVKSVWFPTSLPPSIYDLVSASIPGVSNSVWQLSDNVPSVTIQLVIKKLLYALKYQFSVSSQSPLYLVSNMGLVALLALAVSFRRTLSTFLFVCAVFMLSYAGMIVLMQNQIRYQLFITPAAVSCTLVWVSTWRNSRLGVCLVVLVLAGYLVVDVSMLNRIRNDVLLERAALTAMSEQLSFVDSKSKVAMVGNNLGGWLSLIYALRPAKAMPVFLNVLDEGKFVEVMTLFQPDFVLVRDKLSIGEIPGAVYVKSVDHAGLFAIDVYKMASPIK